MRRGFINLYVLALVAVVSLICLAIIARNWSCRHRRDPKPPVSIQLAVSKAVTGASLECTSGRKDRRTQIVTLAYIAAPVDGPLAEASRANLERIAGKTIRVEVERRGLFRSSSSEDACTGQRRLDEDGGVTAEAPDEPEQIEARGPYKDCPTCGGTGIETITAQTMVNVAMSVWCNGHLPKCRRCRDAMRSRSGEESDYCQEFQDRWKRTVEKFKDFKPYEQPCMCVDTVVVESRSPLLGEVYGESGVLLNLEQIKAGMAEALPDAPKEYKAAEKAAKKSKLGIWK